MLHSSWNQLLNCSRFACSWISHGETDAITNPLIIQKTSVTETIQQTRKDDFVLTSPLSLSPISYFSDYSLAFLTLISIPVIAIAEMKIPLTTLPVDLRSDLLTYLTIILTQIQASESKLSSDSYGLELFSHEAMVALRNATQHQNIREIACGNASVSLFISAIPAFSPQQQIQDSVKRFGCMRILSRCFKPIEKHLRCLLSDLQRSCACQSDQKSSSNADGAPVSSMSSLCAAVIR
jgi:hypothetical protein